MNFNELLKNNAKASDMVPRFRAGTAEDEFGIVNARFHKFKNCYPYFGYIEITIGELSFIMFSGNDDLIAMHYFWYGPNSYESHSLDIWKNKSEKSQVIFDIGAFSGIYSLVAAMANPAANIYAFEPARRTAGRTLLNVFTNRLEKRISIINKGISNTCGYTHFNQYREENILGTVILLS